MIDTGGFREIARTVSVQYPIPFVFACLLAFALCCFGFSLAAAPPLLWLLAGTGAAAAAGALLVVCYAILRRPDLL